MDQYFLAESFWDRFDFDKILLLDQTSVDHLTSSIALALASDKNLIAAGHRVTIVIVDKLRSIVWDRADWHEQKPLV